MKTNSKILGIISIIVLTIGIIFKMMHWPGAGIFLTIGSVSVIAFFIVYLLMGIKPLTTTLEKSAGISGSIAMCLSLAAFLFKVQHWPGTGIIIIISHIGLLVTSILLIIDSVKETEPTKQSIKTLFGYSLFIITVFIILISRMLS